MSAKLCGLIWEIGPTDRASRFVLLAIADNATDDGYAFPGIALLSKKCLFELRQVMRAIQKLEADGWLRVERKARDGKRSEYHIDVEKLESAKDVSRSRDKMSHDTKSRDIYDMSQVTSTTDSGDIYDKPPYPLIGVTVRETSIETADLPSTGLFPEDQKQTPPAPSRPSKADLAHIVRTKLFPQFLEMTDRSAKQYGLTPMRLKQGILRLSECAEKCDWHAGEAIDMFQRAIEAMAASKYHMETGYNEWHNICRSTEQFDSWLSKWRAA